MVMRAMVAMAVLSSIGWVCNTNSKGVSLGADSGGASICQTTNELTCNSPEYRLGTHCSQHRAVTSVQSQA
jgi:hypothetical protein